jgi:hypothetical protein
MHDKCDDGIKRSRSEFDFEGAAFGEFALASCGFAENVLAVVAGHHCLGMTEDDSGFVAASAFDIHEIGVSSGYKTLQLVTLSFTFKSGVEKITIHAG